MDGSCEEKGVAVISELPQGKYRSAPRDALAVTAMRGARRSLADPDGQDAAMAALIKPAYLAADRDFDDLYPLTREAMLCGRREYATARGRFVGYISADTWHFDGLWLRDWIYGCAGAPRPRGTGSGPARCCGSRSDT